MVKKKKVVRKRIVENIKKVLVSRGMSEKEAIAAAREIVPLGACSSGTIPILPE